MIGWLLPRLCDISCESRVKTASARHFSEHAMVRCVPEETDPGNTGRRMSFCPSRRVLVLAASDLISIVGTAVLVGLGRSLYHPHEIWAHIPLLPVLLLAPCLYYAGGLYDAVPQPFPQELRKMETGITLVYLVLAMMLFLERTGGHPSRMVIVLSWAAAMAATPCLRRLARALFAARPWWGGQAVIFGRDGAAGDIARRLLAAPENGLRPVALIRTEQAEQSEQAEQAEATTDDAPAAFPEQWPDFSSALPEYDGPDGAAACALRHPHAHAIVMAEALPARMTGRIIEQAGRLFPTVLLVPGFKDAEMPIWVRPVELAGHTALQMRQNLFDPRRLFIKRLCDLVLAGCMGLALAPVCLLIALGVRLETPGPIFFAHRRIGLGGRPFDILKFRTMRTDAPIVLEACLNKDPDLRREWEQTQKLRNDPRITRFGKFLRRTSLDELPQLLNVLWGEMSMVGPRPIVEEEISRYGASYASYVRVRPGVTGLWQVSGRSATTYARRIALDCYYICNWSIWMDIWILARTPLVVLRGSGAC
jgi:Undecaprenyl-phosphate galactose phosphotransferase WbaP